MENLEKFTMEELHEILIDADMEDVLSKKISDIQYQLLQNNVSQNDAQGATPEVTNEIQTKVTCETCACFDADYESCTLPSIDMSYTCPLNTEMEVISVEIKGNLRGFVEVTRKAFTQSQAYLIIEQLKRDGAQYIRYDFDRMDKLPKGVNLHDKYR